MKAEEVKMEQIQSTVSLKQAIFLQKKNSIYDKIADTIYKSFKYGKWWLAIKFPYQKFQLLNKILKG